MKVSIVRIISIATLLPVASICAQNLVINGSFETPIITRAASYATFAATNVWPWQTGESVFEFWNNGYGPSGGLPNPTESAEGVQNIELLSSANSNSVWQTVSTVPGEAYSFGFFHTPRPGFNNNLTVYLNTKVVGTFSENGTSLSNFVWRSFTSNITATSNLTTLRFSDQQVGAGNEGAHLDGVSLVHVPRLVVESINGSTVRCSWLAVSNEIDQLEYSTNLASGNWLTLGQPITNGQATNLNIVFDSVLPALVEKFYRISTPP